MVGNRVNRTEGKKKPPTKSTSMLSFCHTYKPQDQPVTCAYNSHTYRHVATNDKPLYMVHVQEGGYQDWLAKQSSKKYNVQKRDMESETRPGMTGIGSEVGIFFLV